MKALIIAVVYVFGVIAIFKASRRHGDMTLLGSVIVATWWPLVIVVLLVCELFELMADVLIRIGRKL